VKIIVNQHDIREMGADESKLSGGQLRSRRDEDIPYTSYSISKPIDGGMWKRTDFI